MLFSNRIDAETSNLPDICLADTYSLPATCPTIALRPALQNPTTCPTEPCNLPTEPLT